MDSSWKINPSKAAGTQRASLEVSGIKMTEQWRAGEKKKFLLSFLYASHVYSRIWGTQRQESSWMGLAL